MNHQYECDRMLDSLFNSHSKEPFVSFSPFQRSTIIWLSLLVTTCKADISTILKGGYSRNEILADDGYHYDKPKIPFETPTRPPRPPPPVTEKKCPASQQNPDGSCGYDYPKPDQSFPLPDQYQPPKTTPRPTTTTTQRTTTTTRPTTTVGVLSSLSKDYK